MRRRRAMFISDFLIAEEIISETNNPWYNKRTAKTIQLLIDRLRR